jgi:hypothetical protein
MITTTEELVRELEKLEIEIKKPGDSRDILMEIQIQPH